jgi:16S rRNA (cytosine967-C5)-methyltransferase
LNNFNVDKVREIAIKCLYDVMEKKGYTNIVIDKHLTDNSLKEIDRGFITEIVYGTIRNIFKIDYIIRQNSKIRLKKISPWIINILRAGVYQIMFMDKVPVSAACNESVKLSKKYGHGATSKFVNGVLRNIGRNIDNIKYPSKEQEPILYLSIKYSFPVWMVEMFIKRFGFEFCEDLLAKSNEVPNITVKNNSLKITNNQLKELFTKEAYNFSTGEHITDSFILKNSSDIKKVKGFNEGLFHIQDESSMLVANVLSPSENDIVLDVCAAPGGKSANISQIMNNKGTVISRDIHQHKIKIMNDLFNRLGITNAKASVFDGTKLDNSLIEKCDKVLVDAPCSGLGIIKKKPDIKLQRTKEDIEELANISNEILNKAAKYVKPNGRLVFSTCTITKEENEDALYKFLENNKEFEIEDITDRLPNTLHKDTCKKGYIEIFPNVDNVDGFFIASLKKRKG